MKPRCPMCSKIIKARFRLYDRARLAIGDYCGKACAEHDAWGPRFRSFRVRNIGQGKVL